MVITTAAFARDLAARRKQWGLSVADLAEILGISERALRDWEGDRRTPAFADFIRWSDALAVDFALIVRK